MAWLDAQTALTCLGRSITPITTTTPAVGTNVLSTSTTASQSSSSTVAVAIGVAVPVFACLVLALVLLKFHQYQVRKARKQPTLDFVNAGYRGSPTADGPPPDDFEISPKSLKFFDVLGSGSFGVVYHALLVTKDGSGVESSKSVAVKTLLGELLLIRVLLLGWSLLSSYIHVTFSWTCPCSSQQRVKRFAVFLFCSVLEEWSAKGLNSASCGLHSPRKRWAREAWSQSCSVLFLAFLVLQRGRVKVTTRTCCRRSRIWKTLAIIRILWIWSVAAQCQTLSTLWQSGCLMETWKSYCALLPLK